MSAAEMLCHLAGLKTCGLTKAENLILEAELFTLLCNELKEIFKAQYKDYFRLIKFNIEMEDVMIEANLIRCVINDILSTEEYTLSGIAYYTQTPEDIVFEIASGKNTSPSVFLFRKIIELHRSVRRDLYKEILKKITLKYLEEAETTE